MKYLTAFIFLISFNSLIFGNTNPIWGKTGHRVVGAIADDYLKSSTKRALKKILDQESLAMVSTFADEIKSDERFDKFKPWHYINMPLDSNYEASEKNPEGDLVTGIAYCKTIITNKNSTKTDKAFYLRMLIHLIGDLHQPLHVGLKSDRGGNDFLVEWKSEPSNMHRVWDTDLIEDFGMSYSELAENRYYFSKQEIEDIQKGSTLDWIAETHVLTRQVYQSAKTGDNLGYRYTYDHFSVLRSQLHKAGIRLAQVLNEIL
ncbi:S1/P1 nuclease [Psychroserpens sp.]|uniref:S1/P1 nuclease n=1 Tax=Psychroserpens sp. TaxID=2020870 RepID=UPI001B15EA1C|nr:S1/P1 nuclease [Psychroserpens sp.]MBO6606730.1 S1/P1 nuclease [Psychroserpens sp.]MBO6632548.1 S1/P1 nuclease [Psychroserpens sp.]MBO6653434.1 S1/P1 nuclease [Psychroserpens sp.]MBO6680539.1 S1/P1 nuclease [Psychroserpens sp.]MBO6750503.1 S1/P1 nuclease [Psychroserpens sp.]